MISDTTPVVQADVEEAGQGFHLQHNNELHWYTHEHAALSSPRTCQCFETFLLPEEIKKINFAHILNQFHTCTH